MGNPGQRDSKAGAPRLLARATRELGKVES
jgi:hypothetical protein